MYSKTGAKTSKHAMVTAASNIASLSNIAVRLFDHWHNGQFRLIPALTAPFQTSAFAIIPHTSFLMLLTTPPVPGNPGMLKVKHVDDMAVFNGFRSDAGASALQNSMKEFRQRAPKEIAGIS